MNRDEWLAQRKHSLGSSDSPAILGKSPWKTALEVYLNKTEEIQDKEPTKVQKSGLMLEDYVAARYEEESGHKTYKPADQIQYHPSVSYISCSIDRLASDDNGEYIVELKTTKFKTAEWDDDLGLGMPEHIWIQVQHQLLVSGLQYAVVALVIGGQDLEVRTVWPDAAFQAKLLAELAVFWDRVVRRDPPPIDWDHSSTPDLVKASLDPSPTAKVFDDRVDSQVLVRQFQETKAELSKLSDLKEILYAKVLLLFQGASKLELANGTVLSLIPTKRKGYTVEPTEYIQLRVKEPKS